MGDPIPSLPFRLEHGYTFEETLRLEEFSPDNLLIGGTSVSGEPESLYLGKLAEYQLMKKNIWLDLQGAHVVYVMGKRRSGKTFTLGVLAEGLAAQSWIRQGEKYQGILILDTMNVFSTMPHLVEETFGEDNEQTRELRKWKIESKEPKIALFYPRGCAAPPEGTPREISIRPSDIPIEDWAALFEVDTYKDPIGQLISELYEKVVIQGYTNRDGEELKPNQEFSVDDFVRCLTTCPDMQRYEDSTIGAVRRRLDAVRRLSIFSNVGTDVRELFVPGQISILLLRDLDPVLRGLMIGLIVKKVMSLRSISDKYERLAAIQQANASALLEKDPPAARKAKELYSVYMEEAKQGLPRSWIIIDEAHNYIPSRGIIASRDPLKKYVNEGRNLGLSITVATQQPSGLDPAIQRNADILIVHSMSMRDDIQTTEGMVNTFIPNSVVFDSKERISSRTFEQLVRSLPLGYAVISNDRANRIFTVKVRPRITVHGGKEY